MSVRAYRRAWTLLPIVLMGAWLCAPTPARASCGDYVVIGNQADHGRHHADATLLEGAPADRDWVPPMPAPQPPCHGPSCSGHSHPTAPPPAPAPTGPHGDEWGWPGTASDGAAPAASRWLGGAAAPRLCSFPSSIFHPPRAGS